MERVPEPELMEGDEQAQAYSEADFSEAHDTVIRLFTERLGEVKGRAIDLGCGPADVTVRFSRANPECTVLGVDGSPAMLQCAAARIADNGLQERVELAEQYLPFEAQGRYEVVLSSSLLHHMADPVVLWQTIGAVAASGASVFVWDLRRPESESAAHEMVELYMPDGVRVLRRDFYNSLLAAYEPGEVESQLVTAGLTGLTVEPIGDRHLIVWGRVA